MTNIIIYKIRHNNIVIIHKIQNGLEGGSIIGYDKNGHAQKDIDYTDHGNPKEHPKVPHEHKWDWSNPNKPKWSKVDD